jgi:hypothetical protein
LGPALQRKILQRLEIREISRGGRHIYRAAEPVTAAIENLKQSTPGLVSVVAAGDIRRGSELVSDLVVVAQVQRLEGAPKVVKSGELSVYVTDARRLEIIMLLATGSRRHLEALGQRAADMGMVAVLHAHTDASDGVDALEAMAEASRRHGYSYSASPTIRRRHILQVVSVSPRSTNNTLRSTGSTRRPLMRAAANPFVTVIGHMTGGQLLRRPATRWTSSRC